LSRDLTIAVPDAAISDISHVSVQIGEESWGWDLEDFRREWRGTKQNGTRRYSLPDSVRYGHSLVPYIAQLRNVDFADVRRGVLLTLGLVVAAAAPVALLGWRRPGAAPIAATGLVILGPAILLLARSPVLASGLLGGTVFSSIMLVAWFCCERSAPLDPLTATMYKLALPVALALALMLGLIAGRQVTQASINADAAENTLMAYNLARHGVLSIGSADTGQLNPTNVREPLPPALHALFLKLQPAFSDYESFEEITRAGAGAKMAKRINVFWAITALMLTAVFLWVTTHSPPLTVLGIYLVYSFFLATPEHMDGLYTELPAATLLLLSAVAGFLALKRRSPSFFAFYGMATGLLILTKAAFLYIGLVGCVVIAVLLIVRSEWPRTDIFPRVAIAIGAVLVIVAPWMLRNLHHFSELEVSRRGGRVLLVRAYKSNMTDEEWRGSFFAYAPKGIQAALGALQGFSESDLESGGRLERLARSSNSARDERAQARGTPEAAVSYYRSGLAEWVQMRKRFADRGHPAPAQAADEAAKGRAADLILGNPLGHLKTSLSFAWRGMWVFESKSVNLIVELLNVFAWVSFLVLVIRSFFRRRDAIFVALLLPAGMLLFHALLTHNITRYNAPLLPFLVIAMLLAFQLAVTRAFAFLEHTSGERGGADARERAM
jgi:hypothetical protein